MKLNESVDSLAEAELVAKARLREKNVKEYSVSFTLMGEFIYSSTSCVTVSGYGRFDGKYYIDNCKHSISRGGYTTSITAHRVLEGGY